jgi:DNA-binding response OmpR family regulator
MLNVLIVEDEKAIAHLIDTNLSDEGYRCTCAYDGMQGADLIEKENYDLILLDIMLPEIDGYELLEYVKPLGTPVIFITAKGAVDDRIKGLKLGADDYLVKPFKIGELSARVEAVLRRYGKSEKQIVVADVSVNIDSRQVMKDGRTVDLTVKEFDLLVELVRNKNIALYRDKLYEKIWGESFVGETRTLDAHIWWLRKKLGWEDRIKTVFRIGYRLEG